MKITKYNYSQVLTSLLYLFRTLGLIFTAIALPIFCLALIHSNRYHIYLNDHFLLYQNLLFNFLNALFQFLFFVHLIFIQVPFFNFLFVQNFTIIPFFSHFFYFKILNFCYQMLKIIYFFIYFIINLYVNFLLIIT